MQFEHEDNLCSVISPVGVALSCDQPPKFCSDGILHGWDSKNSHGSSIWVSGNDLTRFSRIIDRFSEPIVLVIGGEDRIMPHDYDVDTIRRISQSEKLLSVFTCNNVLSGRFHGIPIGMDYHTIFRASGEHQWGEAGMSARSQESVVFDCRNQLPHISECKATPVLSNFHLSMSKPRRRKEVRTSIHDKLKKSGWIKWLPRMKRRDLWMSMSDSAFMLCPPGEGYDTHRVWETLAIGRIPIVQSGPINSVYDGLPVWKVGSWGEFASMGVDDLNAVLSGFVEKWHGYEWWRMNLGFWTSEFKKNGARAFRPAPHKEENPLE